MITKRRLALWSAGGALLLGMALLFSFPLKKRSVAPPAATVELFPVSSKNPITPRAESLFAAVDPGQDRWVAEAVTEELEGRLHTLADAIRRGDLGEIARLLHADFRASSLKPLATESISASPGVEVFRSHYEKALSLEAPAFPQALLGWVGEFRAFEVLQFKLVGIQVDPEREPRPARARTEILCEMAGRDEGGASLTRRASWEVDWQSSEGVWKMRRLSLQKSTDGRARRPFFTDISAAALGKNSSYWEQMRPGLDHFRASMDAASGIGVYGHHGVAVGDIDGDGLEDLFVAQPSGLPNRLYQNQGDGTFVDASRESGVDVLDRTSMGLFADYDNDGDEDLFLIIQNRAPLLFENDSRGKFALSRRARFERKDGVRATLASASLADSDQDGYLDLYVCSYRYFATEGEDQQLPLPYPYHDATNGPPNVLFRNRGDGTFEDVTAEAGLNEGNDRFSFASSWGDFDGDGRLDLYVANDFGRNNLYRNLGGGRFREASREAGVEDMGAGMSVAWADYNLDGRDDLYVGNMWSSAGLRLTRQPGYQTEGVRAGYVRHAKGNSLFRNRGDRRFEEVGEQAGVELGRWAWSSDFFDCDNDGDDDLYIANGFITNTSSKDL